MQAELAIGVFDSGIGGLSVLAHIRKSLPYDNLCYVADSAFMPYGCKPEYVVQERCMKIAAFLVKQQCKAIVVACNTATAVAVHQLRTLYDMPVIGMEPALKPAVGHSRSGVVGVLATSGTLGSDKFQRLKKRYAGDAELIVQPCPGLVEAIEQGDLESSEIRDLLELYLQPLLENRIDTLVLGCTHYPFISSMIREMVGENVVIIDTGDAIARELKRQMQLPVSSMVNRPEGSLRFWSSSSDSTDIISRLWGENVLVSHIDI